MIRNFILTKLIYQSCSLRFLPIRKGKSFCSCDFWYIWYKMHIALEPLDFFSPLRLGARLSLLWDLVGLIWETERVTESERQRERETERERQRSPKIEKLRGSGNVIWAKAATLTFMSFLLLKSKAKEYRKIFYSCHKKNGNKVATLAVMGHGCFAKSHILWWQWKIFMIKLRKHTWSKESSK